MPSKQPRMMIFNWITMIGGLVYGTLMTLVVVPCIYDLLNSNKSMVEEDFMNEGNQEVALQFEQSNAGGEAYWIKFRS